MTLQDKSNTHNVPPLNRDNKVKNILPKSANYKPRNGLYSPYNSVGDNFWQYRFKVIYRTPYVYIQQLMIIQEVITHRIKGIVYG